MENDYASAMRELKPCKECAFDFYCGESRLKKCGESRSEWKLREGMIKIWTNGRNIGVRHSAGVSWFESEHVDNAPLPGKRNSGLCSTMGMNPSDENCSMCPINEKCDQSMYELL